MVRVHLLLIILYTYFPEKSIGLLIFFGIFFDRLGICNPEHFLFGNCRKENIQVRALSACGGKRYRVAPV